MIRLKQLRDFARWLSALWALGLGFGVAGSLVHLLLVVALVVIVLQVLQGRRAV